MAKLEDIPEEEKDWRRHSDGRVLDLVNPSLFCVVSGVTRKTNHGPKPLDEWIGAESVVHTREYEKFQWLPTDIVVSPTKKVELCSYINNVHPRDHEGLYLVLPKIISNFIPLFERLIYDISKPDTKIVNRSSELLVGERASDAPNELRIPKKREPKNFQFLTESSRVDLSGRKLQVIVEMTNIELTAEKPNYKGGSWNIEGVVCENMLATGIYYYHCENITESRLAFREEVLELDDDGNDNDVVYALNEDELVIQDVGYLVAREGKIIVFPNIYQHKALPFELVDPSKKGSQKILVFFLVDPAKRILSTSNVPPQQMSWLLKEKSKRMKFSHDVSSESIRLDDWPMSMEIANKYREELMDRRMVDLDREDTIQ